MSKYHSCHSRMATGRRCWYEGKINRAGYWWCSRHVPSPSLDLIPIKELRKIFKMVRYYEKHGELGKGVNFENLWAEAVPKMLKELLHLRRINLEDSK